jgi:redox-sensitive bicupin YhaK (pirin superfamily)
MPQALALQNKAPVLTDPRRIVFRTRGLKHGPISRLMSPGDLGQLLKPFVFLDLFDLGETDVAGGGLHPHSGIATVTHLFAGSIRYEDTTGAQGELPNGGVEWFKAGHGAWHGGGSGPHGARGFQLWLALPADHELGPVESINQTPEDVRSVGPARVLVGDHAGVSSTLQAPGGANYLAVRLKAGETWRYQPSAGHIVGWLAVSRGALSTPDAAEAGELVVFEGSEAPLEIRAETAAEFVIGSAEPHPHDLVLGYYSVHTSPATLQAGEARIDSIGRTLAETGRLRR